MSQEAMEAAIVKSEPKWEGEDGASETGPADWRTNREVKDEQDWENAAGVCGVSEAAARAGLYKDHQVKDELVLGPEILQPPDVVFALQASHKNKFKTCAQATTLDWTCSVSLDQIFVDTEHHTCRVGLQTYKLTLYSQSLLSVQEGKENKSTNNKIRERTRQKCQGIRVRLERNAKSNKRRLSVGGNLNKQKMVTTEKKIASVSGQVYSVTGADVDKTPIVEHLKKANNTKESIPYKCGHCSYASNHKNHLVVHERKHTGEKPYKCSQCSFASAHKSHLVVHIKRHTGEKPYKCTYCSYASARKSNLLVHERKHTGEKPYKCKHCSYVSARKSSLLVHEINHTGEKPYKCEHCSYASAQKKLLQMHERKHTGEKPYKCRQCRFACNHKYYLVAHEKLHSGEKPYKCRHCSYASARKSYLIVHERRHTGEKPYKCGHCSFASAYKSDLRIHIRKHTGEKPYKCTHCSFASARKNRLLVHEIKHDVKTRTSAACIA